METIGKSITVLPGSGVVERIVPEFFGDNGSLYGCFHLPEESHDAHALVICQPTGHEYERCHRAMRQLAVQSARKGIAAVRFDYYGTGDSAGNEEEVDLERMRQDVAEALEACRTRTGARLHTLIGLRLGATLAAQVACSRNDIESLVLYAPVFDGPALLADWQHEQQVFDSKHNHASKQACRGEILGYPVSENFQEEMVQGFEIAFNSTVLKKVLILIDETDKDSAILRDWVDLFATHGVLVSVEVVENIAIWKREAIDSIVPIRSIRRIVKWILEGL